MGFTNPDFKCNGLNWDRIFIRSSFLTTNAVILIVDSGLPVASIDDVQKIVSSLSASNQVSVWLIFMDI